MPTATSLEGSPRSRLVTRWIGVGIGLALLITVLVLVFVASCVTPWQSNVLAISMALGAALLMWGLVGGLQIDVKFKFKALGEVTAGGAAAVFLVVHFVSNEGMAGERCNADGTVAISSQITVVRGQVHELGDTTQLVEGASVHVRHPTRGMSPKTKTNALGEFTVSVDDDQEIEVWATKAGYTRSEIIRVAPSEEISLVPIAVGDTIDEMTDDDGGDVAEDLGPPADETCSVWDPDCPPGTKCGPVSDGVEEVMVRCISLSENPVAVGESCVMDPISWADNCDVGSMCIDPPGPQTSICERWCEGSADSPFCAEPEHYCLVIQPDDFDERVGICRPSCNPLQRNCEGSMGCVFTVGSTFECKPTPAGAGGPGQLCDRAANACVPGSTCVPSTLVPGCGGRQCCTAFCDVGSGRNSPSCLPNQVCEAWPGALPPGMENVGRCVTSSGR